MSRSPRVPALTSVRRHPVPPYQVPTDGTLDDRLSHMARELNKKADKDTVPNFVAITMRGEDGEDYLIYVDSSGTLQCVLVT